MGRPQKAMTPDAFRYNGLSSGKPRGFKNAAAATTDAPARPQPPSNGEPAEGPSKKRRLPLNASDLRWKDFNCCIPSDPNDKTWLCTVCEADGHELARPIKGNTQTLAGSVHDERAFSAMTFLKDNCRNRLDTHLEAFQRWCNLKSTCVLPVLRCLPAVACSQGQAHAGLVAAAGDKRTACTVKCS